MLEALKPAQEPAEAIPTPDGPPADVPPGQEGADAASGPATDLVGKWRADRSGDVFGLWIKEDGQFAWKAIPSGQKPVTIEGQLAATSDTLVLESGAQGSMVAKVKSGGPDQFQFLVVGGPPNDEGLTFRRVKE
jgi:hypothetical protein